MGLVKHLAGVGAIGQISFRKEWDWLNVLWEQVGLVSLSAGACRDGSSLRSSSLNSVRLPSRDHDSDDKAIRGRESKRAKLATRSY